MASSSRNSRTRASFGVFAGLHFTAGEFPFQTNACTPAASSVPNQYFRAAMYNGR